MSIEQNPQLERINDSKIKSAWEEPIICRVEVDLSGWLEQLTGRPNWELLDEDEDESYVSFAMRHGRQEAEVTLYHNGYAVVDVDGEALFDGSLTAGTSDWAHLSYYHAESGEPITLN
jgi:hypothetical protein